MQEIYIDINCDVGEGMGNEATLFPLISSCNIACGGHAGDEESMRHVARMAAKYNVKVGAHPSYPDKENFGRTVLEMSDVALQQSIVWQLERFANILSEEKIRLHHIKPHGALYNAIAKSRHLAMVFLQAIEKYRAESILYAPFASKVADEADRRGFRIKYEAFADRNYEDDLGLVSRKQSNALLTEPQAVAEHLELMVRFGQVKSISGQIIQIKADTYCVHGDTPSALEILTYIDSEFPKKGIHLAK